MNCMTQLVMQVTDQSDH